MMNINKNILILSSILSLAVFFINTYIIKFLPRDLFYFFGIYFPFGLIIISIVIKLFLKEKVVLNWMNMFLILVINLMTFISYSIYMNNALMVK
jgi:hypothetical protein